MSDETPRNDELKIDIGLVDLDDAFHFFNRSFLTLTSFPLLVSHNHLSSIQIFILQKRNLYDHPQQTNSATSSTNQPTQPEKMHLTTPLLATFLSTLTTALPTTYNNTNTSTTNTTTPTPQNFLLLTTTSPHQPQEEKNTSTLPTVSATSLFDPLSNPTYLLRLIAPGYNSLPRFNLTRDGKLETESLGPHGVGEFEYNSTRVRAGEDLKFSSEEGAEQARKGNLGLRDGFLLTVGGEAEGWRVCDGELGQRVVSFLPSWSVLEFFVLEC